MPAWNTCATPSPCPVIPLGRSAGRGGLLRLSRAFPARIGGPPAQRPFVCMGLRPIPLYAPPRAPQGLPAQHPSLLKTKRRHSAHLRFIAPAGRNSTTIHRALSSCKLAGLIPLHPVRRRDADAGRGRLRTGCRGLPSSRVSVQIGWCEPGSGKPPPVIRG